MKSLRIEHFAPGRSVARSHPLALAFILGVVCWIPLNDSYADDQAFLTQEQVRSVLPGKTLRRHGQTGALREWTSNADGSAQITRYPNPGGKHAVRMTTGKWTVREDGKYCLTEDWPDADGGSVDWCSYLHYGPDGELELVRGN